MCFMEPSILLIEDDGDLRSSLSALFGAHGVTVHSAEDGEQGIELFKKHNPAVVVTDLNMPKINGLDVLSELIAKKGDVKVFVISGLTNKGLYFEAANVLGAVKCFNKPTDIKALCSAVLEAMNIEH